MSLIGEICVRSQNIAGNVSLATEHVKYSHKGPEVLGAKSEKSFKQVQNRTMCVQYADSTN